MAIKHSLLGLLTKEPQTGYRLHRILSDQLAGLWQVTEAQVYATLERMAGEGLVERREERSSRSGRPKKAYSITGRGSEAFAAWLVEPVTKQRSLQNEFALKLLFAADDPDLLSRMIAIQRAQLTEVLVAIRQRLNENQPRPRAAARRLVLQSALLSIESQMSWLDLVQRQLLGQDETEPRRGSS